MLYLNYEKNNQDIISKKNEKYYLCGSRKKLIKITPEEKVRQKLIKYLLEELKVPEKMLEVEFSISKIDKTSKLRADIIVFKLIENKKSPLLVIECKEENTLLSSDVYEQLRDYDDILTPDYIAMTNGLEIYIEKYDENQNIFLPLSKIPTYREMLKNNIETELINEKWERCSNDIYNNIDDINDLYYPILNLNLNEKLKRELIKLGDILYDDSISFVPDNDKKLEIIKDNGVIFKEFGNSSGYPWVGLYRNFLVKYNNEYSTAYIGLNQGYLLVGIENEYVKKHHSLQIKINENVLQKLKNKYILSHNGRMTVGNKGSIKNEVVLNYIKNKCPRLVYDNRIILGELKLERNSNVNDIKEVIYNLIEYSLMRDKLRLELK